METFAVTEELPVPVAAPNVAVEETVELFEEPAPTTDVFPFEQLPVFLVGASSSSAAKAALFTKEEKSSSSEAEELSEELFEAVSFS